MPRRKHSPLITCAVLIGAFVWAAASATAQDTTGVGTLSGLVVDTEGVPAGFVTICVADTAQCVVTDAVGAFRLLNIRPGEYRLEVTPPGATALPVGRFEVRAGVDRRIEIALPARDRFETTVTDTAPSEAAPAEVKTSVHLLSAQEIFRAAEALQDVSRYVQTVPGVVIGSDDFRNDIIVRGGSPPRSSSSAYSHWLVSSGDSRERVRHA